MRGVWKVPDAGRGYAMSLEGTPAFERLIEDFTSQHGVRRIHVARKGAPVDVESWKAEAPEGVEVYSWSFKIGDEWHMHMAWKQGVKDV